MHYYNHILSEIFAIGQDKQNIVCNRFHKIIETKLNEEILWRKSAFIAMINGSADSAFDYNSEFIDFIA